MAVLTNDQVDAALPDLPGWERAAGALRRSVKFPTFLDGIEAVRQVKQVLPETIIVMLTVRSDDELLFEALKNGA